MEPQIRTIYRTLGRHANDRVGAGVMDKSGIAVDQSENRSEAWSLVHVLRGRGRYVDAHGNAWDLQPGWCFQRLAGIPQSTYLDPSSRWLEVFIDLGGRLHAPLAEMRVLPPDPLAFALPAASPIPARMLDLVERLGQAAERDLPGLVVTAIDIASAAITSAGDHRPGSRTDPIDEACRLLADESSRRIDLASWCATRSLDYDRFRKQFRQRTGLPPHRYRIRRRIDRACALLRSGLSVQAVAAELGYPSPFEFSAQFRAHLGVPPSRWH